MRHNHDTVDPAAAIAWQASHCDANDAPLTASILRAMVPLAAAPGAVGQHLRGWQGLTLADAMPLRFAGGLHHLHLTGAEPALAPLYAGAVPDQAQVDALVAQVVARHAAALLPWFDGPPQTNEAGRSAAIVAGLLWLAGPLGPVFELNEIGASAGANTMIERYHYDLGGVQVGPADATLRIAPQWRGPPPPAAPLRVAGIMGCDVAPINLADPANAMRLRAYVWAEAHERMARLDGVVALAGAAPPLVQQADAADWVEQRLAAPQAAGVTRVFYHSIVWQYLGAERQARIAAAMAQAGRAATPDRPLAWVMLETNPQTFRHELRVHFWAGGTHGDNVLLGTAHAHGAWVDWIGVDWLGVDRIGVDRTGA